MSRVEINFTCPKCGGSQIEEVMSETVVSTPCRIWIHDGDRPNITYGVPDCEQGHVDRYQCKTCGFVVIDHNDELTEDGLDAGALVKAIERLNNPDPDALPNYERYPNDGYPPNYPTKGAGMSETNQTRPIEMYRIQDGGTWDTVEVEIPANTDPNLIEEVARIEAARTHGLGSYMLYNSMDDQCPEIPRMYDCNVRLTFQLDQTTVGSEIEQTAAAIDQINLTLQREPYGLGARIEKIV